MHSKSSRSKEAFFNWRRSASPVWLNNYISHRIIDAIIYPCPIISWYLFVNEILCKSVFWADMTKCCLIKSQVVCFNKPSDSIWRYGAGSTLPQDGTKPLHEPMLTYYQ